MEDHVPGTDEPADVTTHTANHTAGGAAVCLLYGFPHRLKTPIGGLDPSGLLVPLAEADAALARDFDSLATVSFSNRHIKRYVIGDRHRLNVSLGPRQAVGGRPRGPVTDFCTSVFVTVYEDPGVAFLTINLYSRVWDADDLIAIIQSGSGVNETARPAGEAPDGNGMTFGALLPGDDHAIEMPSLRCAAYEYILRATALLPPREDARANSSFHEESAKEAWQRKFGSPFRCIEIKAGFELERGTQAVAAHGANRFVLDHCRPLYGMVSGDEGWRFFPEEAARRRVARQWGSRDFFSTVVFGHAILMVNLHSDEYVRFQRDRGEAYWGKDFHNAYYSLDSRIAGLEHGPLRALEHCVVAKTLQHESEDIIKDTLHAIQRYYDTGNLDVTSLKRQRNEVVQKRIILYKRVRDLIEVPIREFSELGQMVRQETGIEATMHDIRRRMAEVDAELTHIQQDGDNRRNSQKDKLATFLTCFGVFFTVFGIGLTVIGLALAYYAIYPSASLPRWVDWLMSSSFPASLPPPAGK